MIVAGLIEPMAIAFALMPAEAAKRHFANMVSWMCRRRVLAGRDAAPSGEPARQSRVGGEGTRLAKGVGATPFLRFFTHRFTPSFFVASVVAPPECAMGCTTSKHGH